MSRVGKKIIEIPDGVTVKLGNGILDVNGPLGSESYKLLDGIDVKISEEQSRDSEIYHTTEVIGYMIFGNQ